MGRGCFVAVVLLLLMSWLGLTTLTPAVAAPDEVEWSRVNIPAEGRGSDWVLADGSDIQHLTMAIDGTLYGYVNPSGTSYTLFKSTDGGYSWSYTGKVEDTIVDIATAPDDADTVYYATSSNVSQSTDAGNSFSQLPPNPGGAGSNNIEITSIAVAPLDSHHTIAVGTRDTDNSQYGGVYLLDENRLIPRWLDTNLGNYDVYAVAFSPNFLADWRLVAVVTDETDTMVTSKVGEATWGATIGDAILDKDNSGTPTSVAVTTSADIAFPSDYDATSEDHVLFVAIDAGGDGDVYMIEGVDAPSNSIATDLNTGSDHGLSNIDVTTLAVTGNTATANLLAGAATSAQVYLSTDGGSDWTRSTKPPTGQSKTYVLMAPDFSTSGRAYAATGGTESAFSITQDGGVTWKQVGLIDTAISTILDLAPSPNYSQDNTLFMLTRDGEDSLWRSLNGGTEWERVYSSVLPNVDSIKWVELSPQYGNGSQVMFLTGTWDGKPAIWKSEDDGQSFVLRFTHDPDTSDTFSIDIWAVVNDDTLFIGSFDGSNGLVYHTTNSGWSYSEGAIAGSQSLSSIALSPNYEQDETILVGNTNGWIYWSNDNGASFEPLPPDATSPPLAGSITVAFDPEFSNNNTVYAASSTADKDVYRFIINKDTEWEGIDSTLPSGGMVSQLVASADGILYATNLKADGGMERCLDPTYSLGPTFETVTRGLDDGATLTGLWLRDNTLWSADSHNVRLMTFNDTLALPVTLTSPLNQAGGTGMGNVNLDWETLKGATTYEWQLDYNTDFSTVPSGFEDDTEASSARLPELELSTTYYWRVRATEPVLSPWSAEWSFTTSLSPTVITPELYSPKAGATGVSVKPVFQWSGIAGADSYELIVSTYPALANPTIAKIEAYALPSTAWQSNVSLNYDTTYYWKARAISSDTKSDWSAVGAFTTESPPSPPPPSPPPTVESPLPPSPPPPPQPIVPHWVVYLVGGLLLTIILLLITTLVLVTGSRRL